MSRWHRYRNPFYAVLVIAAVLFCLTAFAYGAMAARALQPTRLGEASASGTQLMAWIDRHGFRLMLIQLAVLAIATVAAITTDEYWEKRGRSRSHENHTPKESSHEGPSGS